MKQGKQNFSFPGSCLIKHGRMFLQKKELSNKMSKRKVTDGIFKTFIGFFFSY
jgi:hypothetical protein